MISSSLKPLFVNLVFILTTSTYAIAIELKETKSGLELKIDEKTKLNLLGKSEGIRHKKVALFNINVYQAKLFFLEKDLLSKDPAVLIQTTPIAIKINPMRSFSGDKLKEAMLVSYEKNVVDPSSNAQEEFLGLISEHKIEKNSPVYLVGIKSKESEDLHLIMQDMNKVIKGPPGFLKEVFSVWLGVPVDQDMKDLQQILVN